MLGAAIVFILAVTAWSASLSTLVFLALSRLGMLRAQPDSSGGYKVGGVRLDDSNSVRLGSTYHYQPQCTAAAAPTVTSLGATCNATVRVAAAPSVACSTVAER
uniref:Uncharacterized protein n=2 Tax=Prymnesium polylepis TaxID=72548 RepID=A0A7S4I8I6_9EUKA|mmetsp:Transcript_2788/g.6219  ORF Transcript_2788/g.6219 Transcript_2788/m.6219 type:complete len:104 (+) Transcript_2788:208-519(+)